MLFSNTASSYSLDYKTDKNFCGEGFVSKEEEKAGFFVDVYIEDAVENLEDSFDVDFFNNLPTPVEEVKPWFIKQFHGFEKPIGIIPESVNAVSRSSVMDFGKFQDLSTFVKQTQNTETAMAVEDSLSTPVIDPNSSLLTNGPFYNATQPSDDLTSGAPDDICGSFTIVPVNTPLPSSTQSLNNVNNNNVRSFSSSSLRSLINDNNCNTYSSYSSFTSSSLDNTQQQMVTSSAPLAYTPSSYSFPTPSSTRSCTPSITPSVTPSSSSSSLIYHELKPRPQSLEASDLMMPTVINDHLYSSIYTKSSTSGQAPSPCPSTSSMTSSSTIDTKDFKRLSLEYEDSDDQPKNSSMRRKNNEASRKSRMTKKQKYDDMVSQEKELTRQNTEMKAKVHELEAITKHLRNYLMDIMKKGTNK